MASFQKSQYIDSLSVETIFARGSNNTTLAPYSVLTTDGHGGTFWVNMSSLKNGVAFNTFSTTLSTFTTGPSAPFFTIADGQNAGLIPDTTAPNTVRMYAKAFGQINVQGGNSIYSYNNPTDTITSNITIVPTENIKIVADSTRNMLYIGQHSNTDTTSTLSTFVGNLTVINTSIARDIASFTSPFVNIIATSFSSFSTALGQTTPSIQYGSNTLDSTGNKIITLTTAYVNTNYAVQLSYNSSNTGLTPLASFSKTLNGFNVRGTSNQGFYWTTYGNT